MTKVKELEVKNVVEIVEELIYQKNLWYPYTIRKVLCSKTFQKYLKDYSEEQINKIIFVMENICHWIKGKPNVNIFNLSNVVSSLFIENNEILKYSLDFIEKKELNIEQSGYSKIIERKLNKIDYKVLNEKVTDELIIQKFNSVKEVDFKNTIELEKTLLKLINNNNLPYSDILTKFFLELDLTDAFKFRNDYKSKDIKKTEKGLLNLLNYLNHLAYILDVTFKKNNLFIFRMLELYLFSKKELKDYFISCLSFDNSNFMATSKNISEKNNAILLKGFTNGLLHIKECYFFESSKFDNSDLGIFRNFTRQYRYDFIKDFCSKLDNNSIYTIYSIGHIEKDTETINHIKELDDLAKDINSKKIKVLMTKQELTEQQRILILDIMDKIQYDSNKFKDIVLNNLYQIGRMATFLSFKVCIENYDYDVRITKNNKDLVWHVFDNRKKIIRELCVCVGDVERIIKLINKYIKEKELLEQYNLI